MNDINYYISYFLEGICIIGMAAALWAIVYMIRSKNKS